MDPEKGNRVRQEELDTRTTSQGTGNTREPFTTSDAVLSNWSSQQGPRRAPPTNFPVTPSPRPPHDGVGDDLHVLHPRPLPHPPPSSHTLSNDPSGSYSADISERSPRSPSERTEPPLDSESPGRGHVAEGSPGLHQAVPSNSSMHSAVPEKGLPRFGPGLPGLGYAVDVPSVPAPVLTSQYRQHTPSDGHSYRGPSPVTQPGGVVDEPFDPYYLQPPARGGGPRRSASSIGSSVLHEVGRDTYVGPSHHGGNPQDLTPGGSYSETQPLDVTLTVRVDAGFQLSKERMTSLSEIDNAGFSWFHLKICLVAGVGFFTDAYDIFSINIAATMLAYVYGDGGSLKGALKAATPVGTFIGQLVFGYLADHVGRKRMYGIELIIIIIGTFGQTLAANSDVGTINIYAALIVWRLIMGLGIGGDYPLSAVIASEFTSTHIRGRLMTAVFANQGWGQFAASITGAIIIDAFKRSAGDESAADFRDIDRAWRILIGLGCIPAAIALGFRLTIPETPRFTMDIERNVRQATDDIDRFLSTGGYKYDPDSIIVRVNAPRASWTDFIDYFMYWQNLKVLLGCAYAWFAIDVIFYGIGLNTDKFFTAIGLNASPTRLSGFSSLCIANILLSAVGFIPGFLATFLLIDYKSKGRFKFEIGRRGIQLMGFGVLTILFIIMGAKFKEAERTSESIFSIDSRSKVFLFLFILASFFQNFGPNTTTFIIPGESFPTRYRTTCHGLCAASGKAGAIISQFAFQDVKPQKILLSYIAFTVTGLLATLLVDETNQQTLEELSNEEQNNFILGPVRAPEGKFTALNHVIPANGRGAPHAHS